jgi:hypothetical protein
MNKIEYIAMSLPYNLKFDIKSELYPYPTLIGIRKDHLEFNYHGSYLSFHKDFSGIPVLRPLSDLNKEMQDGRTYLQYFECMFDFESDKTCPIRMYINSGWTTTINELPFEMVIKLVEWHFDICGLIEKGEAIDVTTLEHNPYESKI